VYYESGHKQFDVFSLLYREYLQKVMEIK